MYAKYILKIPQGFKHLRSYKEGDELVVLFEPIPEGQVIGFHGEIVYTGDITCMQCDSPSCRCFPKVLE